MEGSVVFTVTVETLIYYYTEDYLKKIMGKDIARQLWWC